MVMVGMVGVVMEAEAEVVEEAVFSEAVAVVEGEDLGVNQVVTMIMVNLMLCLPLVAVSF